MSKITTNPSKPRRVVRPLIAAAIDLTVAAGVVNAGELIYKTSNNKIASLNTPGASNANAASCVGVSVDTYPVVFTDGISGSPIPSADTMLPMVQIIEDGDHLFNTTAAETYNAYAPVYLGADGRTISTVATGTSIGYVSPDQRQSAGLAVQPVAFPITGAAGVQIYVHIIPALAK